jgi:transposase
MTTKSTNSPAFFLGIDVGKDDLYCHLIGQCEPIAFRFDNSIEGIEALQNWLRKNAQADLTAACLEQTGHYGIAVSKALFKQNLSSLHLVNPRQIKAFGQQKLRRNKSDTADAKLIAQFLQSEHTDLRAWSPKSIDQEKVTEFTRYSESIVREMAKMKTQLQSVQDSFLKKSLTRRIKSAKAEIEKVRTKIDILIRKNTELQKQSELIESIPGMGDISTQIMLAELPDLSLFDNARQLAAWAGLTPQHFVSGTSGRSTTPITKIGSSHLRRALFMPAMNARVFNPLLKEFGDRLKSNGKKPKQIIVAIMRKLLHQIFGILKSGTPFNPDKQGFKSPANNCCDPLQKLAKN